MCDEYKHTVSAVREGAKTTNQLTASAGLKLTRSNIKHELIKYTSNLLVLYLYR